MTQSKYRRSADLMEADIGDEIVALDPEQGVCFGFNDVAATVWRTLDQQRSFDEIRDRLLDQYDVGIDQCVEEVRELLDRMIEKGLIEQVG